MKHRYKIRYETNTSHVRIKMEPRFNPDIYMLFEL